MKITRRQLISLIRENIKEEELILEKDLSFLNPLSLFRDKNPKVKAFKTEVFELLK